MTLGSPQVAVLVRPSAVNRTVLAAKRGLEHLGGSYDNMMEKLIACGADISRSETKGFR